MDERLERARRQLPELGLETAEDIHQFLRNKPKVIARALGISLGDANGLVEYMWQDDRRLHMLDVYKGVRSRSGERIRAPPTIPRHEPLDSHDPRRIGPISHRDALRESTPITDEWTKAWPEVSREIASRLHRATEYSVICMQIGYVDLAWIGLQRAGMTNVAVIYENNHACGRELQEAREELAAMYQTRFRNFITSPRAGISVCVGWRTEPL